MNPFESGAVIDMNMGHNRATPAPIGADALRVAAQAALTALENLHEIDTETECITIDVRDEIEALRAALASAAQPVPAAEVGGPLNELEELNLLNEPAFPIRGGLHEHQFVGASLRDYFAAKAMQGFVSSYPNGDVNCDFEYLADDAYDMADAMLKARAKGGEE